MRQTDNYELNQWDQSDRILMEDFNNDNSKIDAVLASCARIAVGSYTGDGTYGADTPNTLTFDFAPRLIFFPAVSAATSFAPHYAIAMQGSTALPVPGASTACNITWDSNSVSWYYGGDVPVGGSGPKLQMNAKDTVYPYIAIG